MMGIAFAGVITNGTVFAINVAYAYQLDDVRPAMIAPGSYVFENVGKYLELGVPCMIMSLLDGGYYHLMGLLSGYFGVQAQATQVIIMNTHGIYY